MITYLFLAFGAAAFVHLVCVANFMKNASTTMGAAVALGLGFSVGVVVSALQSNIAMVMEFSTYLAVCLTAYSVEQSFRQGTNFFKKAA
jgi:gamma-glutamyl phosphate reductase